MPRGKLTKLNNKLKQKLSTQVQNGGYPNPPPELLASPMPFDPSNRMGPDALETLVDRHINDNLKMLLYLIDADKLKQVQNIIAGKHVRGTSPHHHHQSHHHQRHTKKHHSGTHYYPQYHIPMPMHQDMHPDPVASPPPMMMRKQMPMPMPIAPAPEMMGQPLAIPQHQHHKRIQPVRIKSRTLRKRAVPPPQYQSNMPEHDMKESSNLVEVMNN